MTGGRMIHRLTSSSYLDSRHYYSTLCTRRSSGGLSSLLAGIATENHNKANKFPQAADPCFYPCLSRVLGFPVKQRPATFGYLYFSQPRLFSASSTIGSKNRGNSCSQEYQLQCEKTGEGETDGWDEEEEVEEDGWEEEEEVEPELGDGGDGGGVVLQGVPWGERVHSMACDVLLEFGDELKLFSFKTTPSGYIYVRLDKLTNQYGCPAMEELESYCLEYKKKLDEVGALGEIPDNLALEVSSPGAERLLNVPDDLSRFKEMPMRVSYLEGSGSSCLEQNGVFFLESIEMEARNCVWKLADVKDNRDPESKGRPLSRKRRDWRLPLPFEMHRKVTLYLEF